ncbi:MAG: hypothetical protein WD963_00125 [Candidatus Paceibacterota bacterium]
MENNNSSNTNTMLIVIVLVLLVGFGVWWFTARGGTAVQESADTTIDINLPGSAETAPAQ